MILRARRRRPLAVLLLAGTFSAAACDRAADEPEAGARTPAPTIADARTGDGGAVAAADIGADTARIFISPEESSDERPVTVYPDLTRYDWYARGEPLVHEGRAYVAGGPLVAAPASAMEPLGEYGGVAYYRRGGDGLETLYVPVYGRYWLGFRLRDGAAGG